MGAGGQRHNAGRPQGRSGRISKRKSLAPTGVRSPDRQHVASHYTDLAEVVLQSIISAVFIVTG